MTKMRSFRPCLFTIFYPYKVGTIITPFLQMEETEAQKVIKLFTIT